MLTSSTVMCTEAKMDRKRGYIKIKERAKDFLSLICMGKFTQLYGMHVKERKVVF